MKISIVVPTYNRPQLLKRCLKALTEQNFEVSEYEIIIVTDGPDNRTALLVSEIKEQFPKHTIHCYGLGLKKGPAASRNKGWKLAEAELIAFTDDDTIPDKNWIKTFYDQYAREADRIYKVYKGKLIVPLNHMPTDHERNTANLETADFVTANCCCTKAALQKIRGFDEQFTMAYREDSDLEFKFLLNRIPIQTLPEAIVVHPVRSAHWGVSLKEQKKSMFNALLFKKYPTLYKEKIMRRPLWNYYIMIVLFFSAFIALLNEANLLSLLFILGWLTMVTDFTLKRLRGASKSFSHVTEMFLTSAVIPFLSVYWTLYGAWKYKVLYL